MMKKHFMISLIAVLGLLSACSPQPLQTIGADQYYVQIEGDGQEYKSQNDTRYEYTLNGVDEDGEKEEFTFTAGKQLRKDAHLRIYSKDHEVITYEEVEEGEVPSKALQLLKE